MSIEQVKLTVFDNRFLTLLPRGLMIPRDTATTDSRRLANPHYSDIILFDNVRTIRDRPDLIIEDHVFHYGPFSYITRYSS